MKKKVLAEAILFIVPISLGLLAAKYIHSTAAVCVTWIITNIISHFVAKTYWK